MYSCDSKLILIFSITLDSLMKEISKEQDLFKIWKLSLNFWTVE